MSVCAEDPSLLGRRDGALLYLIVVMVLPPEGVALMEVDDVRERIRLPGQPDVRLPVRGTQLLHTWMQTRGNRPGRLFPQKNHDDTRPMSRNAIQAALHRRCAQAGIGWFNLDDLARTQALLACGRWRPECCCPLPLTPAGEPYWPDQLNPNAIRFVRGLASGERGRILRLLEVFGGILRPGRSIFEIDWGAIDGFEILRAMDIASASNSARHMHALQRCVDALRYGGQRRGSDA